MKSAHPGVLGQRRKWEAVLGSRKVQCSMVHSEKCQPMYLSSFDTPAILKIPCTLFITDLNKIVPWFQSYIISSLCDQPL